jgi:hypothetical protein
MVDTCLVVAADGKKLKFAIGSFAKGDKGLLIGVASRGFRAIFNKPPAANSGVQTLCRTGDIPETPAERRSVKDEAQRFHSHAEFLTEGSGKRVPVCRSMSRSSTVTAAKSSIRRNNGEIVRRLL